ncbi:hypothetical protein KI387_034612, partial [Taxus chinensis]
CEHVMSNTDTVTSSLMKLTELRDQIAAIGMKAEDEELVPAALNGFSAPWQHFLQGVCPHENIPTFERVWDVVIHEEMGRYCCSQRMRSRN